MFQEIVLGFKKDHCGKKKKKIANDKRDAAAVYIETKNKIF